MGYCSWEASQVKDQVKIIIDAVSDKVSDVQRADHADWLKDLAGSFKPYGIDEFDGLAEAIEKKP
jgi:hypothetical protein